ncbi:L-seryl-tRNA(Sec) selenium transferase [Yimella sp. RIT 621]|uniref:L-seryl-tRNA(Sec) selenium transferase n=1 Tax=Yimella sp. RIT 621 TaxID=2510323 RepID=UPI00101BAFE8|nr:L-seryl-tRNA(Sec) selenium transferase [Yimella sp. RIT 621]RYG78049.1 L-seryl-tRNA(Sec) selenium transferase [Yimella sp. RIT 621]
MSTDDPRSRIPRTDALLTSPAAQDARTCLAEGRIQQVVQDVLARARRGDIAPESVEPELSDRLTAERPSRLTPVINATGVVVHTNLGRAPLSPAAAAAVQQASGYVDVEMDLAAGVRSKRGTAARDALLDACPVAEAALVVNNAAAALVLATTALAAGKKVILSRGEFIEIGAGFRLPDLIESTGARLCEVGTTNRTSVADYVDAISEETGCILKVHPSNFRVHGFTRSADVAELRSAVSELPIVHDLGSGLLAPDPTLPHEPDASTALTDGADLVIASGDKLLGGPQAGILLGKAELVERLAKHPLARAVRVDKLTLAALEATLAGPTPPVSQYLHADAAQLRKRAEAIAGPLGVQVVPHDGRVGGGGAPGVALSGWAIHLPEKVAALLRTGDPAILTRVHDGACLLDLRCVPEQDDTRVLDALRAALGS